MKNELPNKYGKPQGNPGEYIDPDSRHPVMDIAGRGTADKASRRKKAPLAPSRGGASEDPADYMDRAAHLYGVQDARRIVRKGPVGAGLVPAGDGVSPGWTNPPAYSGGLT